MTKEFVSQSISDIQADILLLEKMHIVERIVHENQLQDTEFSVFTSQDRYRCVLDNVESKLQEVRQILLPEQEGEKDESTIKSCPTSVC